MDRTGAWHAARERGSAWAIRLLAFALRLMGLRLTRLMLFPVVAYFFATGRRGRAASRQYLQRLYSTERGRQALGRRPGLRDQFRHMHGFAVTALEQFRFWMAGPGEFEVKTKGFHHLKALADRGRGALLFGAHIGSVAVLRRLAPLEGLRINVVMFRRQAMRFNTTLREVAPESDMRVLEIDPSSATSILKMKACIDRGEMVALLADRPAPGDTAGRRVLRMPFLGREAPFPTGPWLVAALLECPVLFTCGLRLGTSRYRLMARPLADRVVLPRMDREKHLRSYLSGYIAALEELCFERPYQWFNFYDFWSADGA